MSCTEISYKTVSYPTPDEPVLSKADVEGLRDLRSSIEANIRELHRLENLEQSVANRGRSVLHSLSKRELAPDHYVRKSALREKVFAEQRTYLVLQAKIERRISTVPDHAARLMLSWYYADSLTYAQAAACFGGITGSGVQMILRRYFARAKRGRDSP